MALRSLTNRVAAFNVGRHIIDVEVAAALAGPGRARCADLLMHMKLTRVMLSRLADDLAFPMMLGLIVVTVLGLAYGVHRLVEKPLSRMMRRRLNAAVDGIRSADAAAKAKKETSVVPATAPGMTIDEKWPPANPLRRLDDVARPAEAP